MSEADPNGKSAHEPGSKLDDGKNMVGLVMQGFRRALLGVSRVGTFGAKKYTKNGWKEVPDGYDRYQDALYRHLLAEGLDEQSGLPHLYHAAWNLLAMIELKEAGPREVHDCNLSDAAKAHFNGADLLVPAIHCVGKEIKIAKSAGMVPVEWTNGQVSKLRGEIKAEDLPVKRIHVSGNGRTEPLKFADPVYMSEATAKAIERWETAPQDWAFVFTAPMGPDDLEMDGVKVFTLPVRDVTKALNSLIHRNQMDWQFHLRAMGIKACKKDLMRKFSGTKFGPVPAV